MNKNTEVKNTEVRNIDIEGVSFNVDCLREYLSVKFPDITEWTDEEIQLHLIEGTESKDVLRLFSAYLSGSICDNVDYWLGLDWKTFSKEIYSFSDYVGGFAMDVINILVQLQFDRADPKKQRELIMKFPFIHTICHWPLFTMDDIEHMQEFIKENKDYGLIPHIKYLLALAKIRGQGCIPDIKQGIDDMYQLAAAKHPPAIYWIICMKDYSNTMEYISDLIKLWKNYHYIPALMSLLEYHDDLNDCPLDEKVRYSVKSHPYYIACEKLHDESYEDAGYNEFLDKTGIVPFVKSNNEKHTLGYYRGLIDLENQQKIVIKGKLEF